MANPNTLPLSSSSTPHIILFPFMSKGHTIPLLHLAHLIHHRHRPRATFTIFTTPSNEPFISLSLSSLPPQLINIISLPFPTTDSIPVGVESTDQLPSMSLFHDFANTTQGLQPAFETALDNLRKTKLSSSSFIFMISDGFLYWTQQSASKFGIPRLVFYGMNCYAMTICRVVTRHRTLCGVELDDELISIPDFPWIKVTRNDFESPFNEAEPKGLKYDFVMKCGMATSNSYGMLVNSFYELEGKFLDYLNSEFEPKNWLIGPLCLAEKLKSEEPKKLNNLFEWLDRRQAEGKHVLYVAFGSQAEISNEQLMEISIGLEKSGVNFLWALRIKPNQEEVMEGFEERVKGRGLVVKGWVEQRQVLEHESVQGFLSHCGWNSVIESICAGVPILAWPMLAEQPLNARMVVEEIKVGLRVVNCNGSVRGFVEGEELSKIVKELMEGERGKVVRNRVKELREATNIAVEEGGSSWYNLELLLNELDGTQSSVNHENGMISYKNNGLTE